MSQDIDTSPSSNVNWREPTTEDKSKRRFWAGGRRLVSVCELGWQPFGSQRGQVVVCLYILRGRVNAKWWVASYDQSRWIDIRFGGLPNSMHLKLGYALKGRSWLSREEAQSTLILEILRGRVLAMQVEREENMEAAVHAWFEAKENAH